MAFPRRASPDGDWTKHIAYHVDRAAHGTTTTEQPADSHVIRLHRRTHQASYHTSWVGQPTAATAITEWNRPGPSAATTTMASRIVGTRRRGPLYA